MSTFSTADRVGRRGSSLRSLSSIAASVEILAADRLRWLGQVRGIDPGRSLRSALEGLLYECCYVTGGPSLPVWRDVRYPDGLVASHAARLEAACPTHVTVREGTPVGRWTADRVELRLLGISISARPDAVAPTTDPSRADVSMPSIRRNSSPGFWSLFGARHPLDEDLDDIVRVYWNISAEGAPELVRALAPRLDDARVPFRLKLLARPPDYNGRCDAAVLYLGRRWWDASAVAVRDTYRLVAPLLSSGATPLLTRRLGPGLGFADDPGGGVSFGEHRCALIAAGILEAAEEGIAARAEVTERIVAALEAGGVDLRRPHLNAGSTDVAASFAVRRPGRRSAAVLSDLDVARRVAGLLVATATWHEDRCAWLAPALLNRPGGGLEQGWSSTGPDLYDGTSGIGLALAEAVHVLGDDTMARTAAAALRHGLARAREIEARFAAGLFTGTPGVAVAALRGAALLGDAELRTSALALLERVPPTAEFDLMWGKAGAMLGLLVAGSIEPRGFQLAVGIGDELLEASTPEASGRSWASPTLSVRSNLVGLSHGASGAAVALLELGRATGAARFRAAALEALHYVSSHFDRRHQNWPTLLVDEVPTSKDEPSYQATWCHGAPGIALAHLRAAQLSGERRYLGVAAAALRTTERATRQWLSSGRWNLCLCHGLLGNAEVLRLGAAVHDAGGTLAAVTQAVRGAAARVLPLDVPFGEPPGLMNGLAGVLHFFLRTVDPGVPPVLLVEPGRWTSRTP